MAYAKPADPRKREALAYAAPEADPEADAEGSADYQLETDAWVGNDGGYYGYYPSFGVYVQNIWNYFTSPF